MATINLGAIKFNWKGAYNNSTAYAVDDVVSSGGNSYVCIQASQGNALGNATAYWNIMSTKGTNGTNGTDLSSTLSTRGDLLFKNASALARLAKGTAGQVLGQGANDPAWVNGSSSTLTTQGDILYRDGSGLQRLAKGTAGQHLLMNSGANAPQWTTSAGGGLKQVVYVNNSTEFSTTSTSFQACPPEITITPATTSSKIVIQSEIPIGTYEDGYPDMTLYRKIGSGSFSEVVTRPSNPNGGNSQTAWVSLRNNSVSSQNKYEMNGVSDIFRDAPNTTSACTYKWYGKTSNGGALYVNCSRHQIENQTNVYNMLGVSKMIAWEITV